MADITETELKRLRELCEKATPIDVPRLIEEVERLRTDSVRLVSEIAGWRAVVEELKVALDQRDEARAEVERLGRWSCSGCGCRFNSTAHDGPHALDGVTRCSRCVEVEALKAKAQGGGNG